MGLKPTISIFGVFFAISVIMFQIAIKLLNTKTFFVILTIYSTALTTSQAANECVDYLNSKPVGSRQLNTRTQIYNILEASIYSLINDIETLTMFLENSDPQISEVGRNKVLKLTNDLTHLWDSTVEILDVLNPLKPQLGLSNNNLLPLFSEIKQKIAKNKTSFTTAKDYAARLLLRYSTETSMTFDNLMENPKLTLAEFGYELKMDTDEMIKIVFSSDIVKELFHSETTVQSRVVIRSLKDAKKGLFGANYEGAGIKRRYSDRNLVEIRSIGKDANFRLYGYIYNSNEVHIVSYTTSSNHDSELLQQRIDDSIYNSRELRGHVKKNP